MTVLKIDHIISFSSEDDTHVAKNLLGSNPKLKWKCKTKGEKTAVLLLQLEKASVISGIDIGNEHSAYIEVLVSRSGQSDTDYKTLLVMSSFMTAYESRESKEINKVRMFKKNDFSIPECHEKWDRVKIVCTQPFNRHVQYGLSFIKFHTNDGEPNDNIKDSKTFGQFKLLPDTPTEFSPGSLFARRKELADEKPKTAAAAIRAATSSVLNNNDLTPIQSPNLLAKLKHVTQTKIDPNTDATPMKNRNRDELLYTDDDQKPNEKIDRLVEMKNAEKAAKLEEEQKTPKPTKKRTINEKQPNTVEKVKDTVTPKESTVKATKRHLDEKPEKSPKKTKKSPITKPFHKLLEGVVLVISGIQNPDRANLRSKSLEMGAKYKPDWDNTCTHLICAFMNTPKFNQVKGKGKIVTRQWIEDCHAKRCKLPWRRYALDKKDKSEEESDEEIWEKKEELSIPVSPSLPNDDTMDQGSDTEEEVKRLLNLGASTSSTSNDVVSDPYTVDDVASNDPYTVDTDTDEENLETRRRLLEKSSDFFKDKTFFIDHFEDYIQDTLKNYVFIHGGNLEDDLIDSVDYIICGKEEAQNLKGINSNSFCILPDWIVDCHKCRQFIPPDEYFIL